VNATYWPTSETSCSIQTHTREHAAKVKRLDTARRIAVSVHGKPLEVWNVEYALPWVRRKLAVLLPDAREVDGGDWTTFFRSGRAVGQNRKLEPCFS
jgi:hypothetical protein